MRTAFCQRSRLRGVSYPCKSEEGVAHDTERIQSLTAVNRSQEDISIAMAVSEDIRRLAEVALSACCTSAAPYSCLVGAIVPFWLCIEREVAEYCVCYAA